MAERNFQNRTIFHGDNLDFLRNINSASVDLIATDPPFNKNKDFHAASNTKAAGARFTDRWHWDEDVLPQWQDSLKDDKPATWHFINGVRAAGHDDMAAFLCWLGVRLMECHRILRRDGSLYLHIDYTAHAYAKVLMDTIFGRENFRNEIVWDRNDGRAKGSQHASKKWGANTDSILYYAKSADAKLRAYRDLTDAEVATKFNKIDAAGNRYYTGIPIFRSPSMADRPNLCYEWRGFTNPHPSGWRLKRERLEEEYQKGNVVIREDGKLERRMYARDYPGFPMGNLWADIPRLGNQAEKLGYPTQKPLALYERIIKASSNEGDMVLDPFCGCATTPVAAERLGRQWIGMDTWEKTHQVVLDRLNSEKRIFGEDAIQLVNDPDALERTDDEEVAADYLPPIYKRSRQSGISRADMMDILVREWGLVCWGCGFEPPHIDFLELDHNEPASDGGSNELPNRAPLCSPCNRLKSNIYTLAGLRRANKKEGRWYGDIPIDKKIVIRAAVDWAEAELKRRARQAELAVGA